MLIGLGGGAASSVTSGSSSEDLDFASVQRQNPEMERRCQEVIDQCWQLGQQNPIAFIHDVGAGGLSNAFPELAKDGGCGARFELREVPNDEPGMAPHEIWCNESQERYVMAVKPENLTLFTEICARERCPMAVVGEALSEQKLVLNDTHFDNKPVDLPMEVLFGKPPKMHRTAEKHRAVTQVFDYQNIDLTQAIERVLQHPSVASKQFLITIGDRSITGMVARDQMVGPWQVPVADCAVTTLAFDSYAGEAMSMGERCPLALLDAPASGRMAIGEAITNIAATRIQQLSDIKLSANWMCAAGHRGEDEKLYRTVEAVGMELCPALGLTIPVGKDSMSMRTAWQEAGEDKAVTAPLSLVVSAFSPVVDVRATLTPQIQPETGNTLLFIDLANNKQRLGASIFSQVYGQLGENGPDVENPATIKQFFSAMQQCLKDNLLTAYHDRSDGGLLACLAEMSFAGHCGLDIDITCLGSDPFAALFNEELGAVIQVSQANLPAVEDIFSQHQLANFTHKLGTATVGDSLHFACKGKTVVQASRQAWHSLWAKTSYHVQRLRDNPECADQEYALIQQPNPGLSAHLTFNTQENISAAYINRGARPKVAVLREQGVNGQLEMAAAFYQAGFDAVDVHMSDILAQRLSLSAFSGLVACGGFSYGDVLGAGRGWANTILFNSVARDQFEAFFQRADTFSLGVCNGCQMMSALKALVPGASHWPKFEKNTSEQFEARTSLVKIENSPSLFLSGMAGSHLPVAVAHAEGRAVFPDAATAQRAQPTVALRYLDNQLTVTEAYPANPNGSPQGITGLCSEDGRATIMMPHPERVFRSVTNSWYPEEWGEDGPWLRMFRNARVAID